jgi:hypothetical protein
MIVEGIVHDLEANDARPISRDKSRECKQTKTKMATAAAGSLEMLVHNIQEQLRENNEIMQ